MKKIGVALGLLGLLTVLAFVFLDSPTRSASQTIAWVKCETGDCENPGIRENPGTRGLPASGLNVVFHPTERADGQRVGRVAKDFVYCHDATGDVIKVPTDYFTNFATIPWYLRFYIDPMGDHMEAAVVHDWLYSVGGTPTEERKQKADEIFRDVLKESGVNIIRRNLMYQAVSAVGSSYFNLTGEITMRAEDWSVRTIEAPASGVIETVEKCQTPFVAVQ
ncbi:MAG: DUF1353 domain-containing protein [Hyphomicrobiaceae bacterium]